MDVRSYLFDLLGIRNIQDNGIDIPSSTVLNFQEGLRAEHANGKVNISLSDDIPYPSEDNNIATKIYVDDAVFEAINTSISVRIVEETTTDFILSDAGADVRVNTSDPATITLDKYDVTELPWYDNTIIHITQLGAGQVEIDAGDDVTINIASGFTNKLRTQYSVAVLKRLGNTDTWILSGDLELE